MKQKKLIPTLFVTALISVALAGCAGTNTGTPSQVPDPNQPETADFSLSMTPTVDVLGFTVDKTKLPSGYELQQTSPDPEVAKYVVYNPDSPDCSVFLGTTFAPSYYYSWGDEFITKQLSWNRLQGGSGVTNITWDRQTINADGGKSLEVIVTSWDDDGARTGAGPSSSMAAYRLFDVLKPNGYDPEAMMKGAEASGQTIDPNLITEEGLYGSDVKQGLPGFSAEYICSGNNAQADMNIFNQILDSVTVTGVS